MRKPVLIGGSLGLLLLVVIATFLWMAGKPLGPVANIAPPRAASPRIVPPAPTASMAPLAVPSSPQTDVAKHDRRRRLAEVRAEFRALSAQGPQASPQKMRALVDELEALSGPSFDPRYFQSLRTMLDLNAKLQELNAELQVLIKSKSPKDAARQQVVLAEMRTLGERVAVEAKAIQAFVPKPTRAGKLP
ncbi:hypothetical protein [Paracidovorax sp. MALMAid1276]|uniref:hypothetical protein n=1 Tax=Paracidovorax sp. MALMAid1276 TaxID=3411631 RepID=UPI003B9BEEB0